MGDAQREITPPVSPTGSGDNPPNTDVVTVNSDSTTVSTIPVITFPIIPAGFSAVATNLGKINNTGGIAGTNKCLVLPFKGINGKSYISAFNQNNFNSEEDCIHYFRNEDVKVGRKATVNGVIVVYRNIGQAVLDVGIEAYLKESNQFVFEFQRQTIGNDSVDEKIYTTIFNVIVTGERPRIIIRKPAMQGSISIISVTMFGNMAEGDQL